MKIKKRKEKKKKRIERYGRYEKISSTMLPIDTHLQKQFEAKGIIEA